MNPKNRSPQRAMMPSSETSLEALDPYPVIPYAKHAYA
jgi:hypothetical protein